MTTEQPSFGARWMVACIERLYACAYDIAARSTRRQWHPAARVVLWFLASVTMHEVALGWALMRVPAVLLDAERLDRHRKRLCLRNAGRGLANGAYQYNRPSIALWWELPSANAPSNRATGICRRRFLPRRGSGRAPPAL